MTYGDVDVDHMQGYNILVMPGRLWTKSRWFHMTHLLVVLANLDFHCHAYKPSKRAVNIRNREKGKRMIKRLAFTHSTREMDTTPR